MWYRLSCSYEGQLCDDTCPYYRTYKIDYPQITDHILLELICIANRYYIDLEGTDIETMKNSLLENFMFFKRDIKEDIPTLFKEEQQW